LGEYVLQFGGPVGRVDVDEDRTDFRRRVLRDHPLDRIGRPNSDAIAVSHTERQQAAGEDVGCILELGVRHAQALMHGDYRIRRGETLDDRYRSSHR
jgi:hypothetical protein